MGDKRAKKVARRKKRLEQKRKDHINTVVIPRERSIEQIVPEEKFNASAFNIRTPAAPKIVAQKTGFDKSVWAPKKAP